MSDFFCISHLLCVYSFSSSSFLWWFFFFNVIERHFHLPHFIPTVKDSQCFLVSLDFLCLMYFSQFNAVCLRDCGRSVICALIKIPTQWVRFPIAKEKKEKKIREKKTRNDAKCSAKSGQSLAIHLSFYSIL